MTTGTARLRFWTPALVAAGGLALCAATADAQHCAYSYGSARSTVVYSSASPGTTVIYVEPGRYRGHASVRYDYPLRRYHYVPRHHTSHRRIFGYHGHRSHVSTGHHGRRHFRRGHIVRHGRGHHGRRGLRFRHR